MGTDKNDQTGFNEDYSSHKYVNNVLVNFHAKKFKSAGFNEYSDVFELFATLSHQMEWDGQIISVESTNWTVISLL